MHFELLVDEPSKEEALKNLVPRIIGSEHSFGIREYAEKKLVARLRGYKKIGGSQVIVVLRDEDRKDCHQLKAMMEEMADGCGLITKSQARSGQNYQVINRIAIEELEAWFFGDIPALVRAYPGVPATLGEKARFRDPDAIRGGTWEALFRVLQRAGYYRGLRRPPKKELARNISMHMDPDRNRSRSFQVFRDALERAMQISF